MTAQIAIDSSPDREFQIASRAAIEFVTRPVLEPVYCTGTLGNGKACRAKLFYGVLVQVDDPMQALIHHPCDRCGQVAYFGIVTNSG